MCGYQRGPLPHILECRWYGDLSQCCLNPGSRQYRDACPKPWLQEGFEPEGFDNGRHSSPRG